MFKVKILTNDYTMGCLDNVLEYIKSHINDYVVDLKELVSYPTVAVYSDSERSFVSASAMLKNHLLAAGVEDVRLLSDYGHPVIYASQSVSSPLPTVLLYAHYDVQPADPLDLWQSDPYDLVVKDGVMYGRGVSDDKSLVISIIKSLEVINKYCLDLKYNVKILFESSEESGSRELSAMLDTGNPKYEFYKDLFSASTLLACDLSMSSELHPSITISCRGCVACELTIIGPNRDLHSGHYGGIIGNPIHELSRLIASLHDEDNHISVEGFYSGVSTTDEKKKMLEGVKIDEDFYKKDLNVDGFVIEKGFSGYQSCRLRPTIEVNGIYGGHTKEGGKTIIPSSATAKLSMRLVDSQDPEKIFHLFERHIKKHINKAFKYKLVCNDHGSVAVESDLISPVFRSYKKALEEEYGEAAVYIRAGGSIPIMSTFKTALGCDIVFVGFGGPNSNCHGPNENYSLTSFEKGIKTLVRLLTQN